MRSEAHLPTPGSSVTPLAPTVILFIAALVLFWSGFFTMDFLLSGFYTWPRTSRILTLTLAVIILSYEFVYKEQWARASGNSFRLVLLFCLLPYMLGTLALLLLLNWA